MKKQGIIKSVSTLFPQAMAGATLKDDFWANDILWQLFQKLSVKWSLLQFYRNKEIISLAN